MKEVTLDRLKQVLGEQDGNIKQAIKALQEAGYPTCKNTIYAMIKDNPGFFKDYHDPATRTPLKIPAPTPESLAEGRIVPPSAEAGLTTPAEEDRLMQEGMKAAGYDEKTIAKINGVDQFVKHGLPTAINFTYGSLVEQIYTQGKAMKFVLEDIINGNRIVEKYVEYEGKTVKIEEDFWQPNMIAKVIADIPKYTEALAKATIAMDTVANTKLRAEEIFRQEHPGGGEGRPPEKRKKQLAVGPRTLNA